MEEIVRTECACERCRACCKAMPGMLVPGDMEAILSEYVPRDWSEKEISDWIGCHFVASEGAMVAVGGHIGRVRTITPAPRSASDPTCVFLDSDERCAIHSVAPWGCRMCDSHMGRDQADPIVKCGLWMICKDLRDFEESVEAEGPICIHERNGVCRGLYAAMWQEMTEQGRVARPLVERRKHLHKLFAELG